MSFAIRAEKINKKYPFASSVPSDRKARDSELKELFDEQELEKQNREAQEEARQLDPVFSTAGPEELFHTGGATHTHEDGPDENPGLKALKSFTNDPNAPDVNPGAGETGEKKRSFFGNLLKGAGSLFGGDGEGEGNLSSYLNIGSGIVSAGTSLLNRNDVEDPEIINPTLFKPTATFRGIDRSPIQREFSHQLDSTKYNLSKSGVDFDTLSAGVNKVSNVYSEAYGKAEVAAQEADSAEGARVEGIVNQAGLINTEAINQSRIDQASRQDAVDQKRRDYLDVLGESLSGILEQEANRAYSKELGPFMDQIAKLDGLLNK